MAELGCEYNPVLWRLFINSSKTSFKVVLLHNGNIKPSIPSEVLPSIQYDTMKILLNLLQYPKYNWKICSNLKFLSFWGYSWGTQNICAFYVYRTVGKTALTMQLQYGSPKPSDQKT